MSGILGPFTETLRNMGLTASPRMENNVIKLEITEQELYNALTRGLDPRVKSAISLRIEPGKLVIEVKLI